MLPYEISFRKPTPFVMLSVLSLPSSMDASKAVEKEPETPAPQARRHGHRWLLRTIVFVSAACATFLALAPRPAFASVVAPVACWAGLEVCGVCGPTCDAVCTH